MTYFVKQKVDPIPIILAALSQEPLKAKKIGNKTGFKRDFLYDRLNEMKSIGLIDTFHKARIKGRFFKITELGKEELKKYGKEDK